MAGIGTELSIAEQESSEVFALLGRYAVILVVIYRRFGRTHGPHPQGFGL